MTEGTAFVDILEGAQRVAGTLAARRRGDRGGALAMITSFEDETSRADAALLVADLLVGLLAHEQGRPVDEVLSELSLQLADMAS